MEYEVNNGWVEKPTRTSPTLPIRLSLSHRSYRELGRPPPASRVQGRSLHSAVRRAIADTGAQVNVVDVDTIRGMGLSAESLLATRTKIKGVAAGSRLDLLGVVSTSTTFTCAPVSAIARLTALCNDLPCTRLAGGGLPSSLYDLWLSDNLIGSVGDVLVGFSTQPLFTSYSIYARGCVYVLCL